MASLMHFFSCTMWLLTVTTHPILTSASHCSFNSRLEEATVTQQQGQYLDLQNPLTCSGNLTAWHFCYYTADMHPPDFSHNTFHWAWLRVWRRVNSSVVLQQIHNHRLRLRNHSPNNSFLCHDEVLLEPDSIQAGDILGVYIPVTPVLPVPVIGQGVSGYSLFRDTRENSIAFSSTTLTTDSLVMQNNFVLHVDADIVASDSSVPEIEPPQPVPRTSTPYGARSTPNPSPSTVFPSSTTHLESSITSLATTVYTSALQGPVTTSTSSSLSNSRLPSTFPQATTLFPTPKYDGGVETPSFTVSVVESMTTITPPPTMEERTSSGGGAMLEWPFMVGIAVGTFLLIMIIIVTVLLFLVMCARRHRDSQKIPVSGEIFTNVVTAANPETIFGNVYSKAIEEPIAYQQSDKVESNTVYEIPLKIRSTSNSVSGSTSSVFSSGDAQSGSAHPYETPMVMSVSSRLNLFKSSSTYEICQNAEPKPQPYQTPLETQCMENPKPKVRPLLLDQEGNCPEPSLAEKHSQLMAEAKAAIAEKGRMISLSDSTSEEGYCIIGQSVKLFEQANINGSAHNSPDMYCIPPSDERDILYTLEKLNVTKIPRDSIQMINHLGTGEFGSVAKAYWRNKSGHKEVAVKSVPPNASSTERVKLLQEAAMMGQFQHPNVAKLQGIVTNGMPFMLVMEYLPKGDLRTCLVRMNRRSLPSNISKLLLSYSQQVALGMHYLASKGFIHRDLAARNIFVSQNDICKVGDFGMSRDLADASHYISKGGKIPVRWTAPEAMYYHKYSTASDVWSYGCVLYEIWSLGRLPFKTYTNAQVLQRLDSGYRLPPPSGCPRAIYELMIHCWHPYAQHRPEFKTILLQLLGDENNLLHIPVSDASTSQQASQLGKPLRAGEYMYSDLQRAYLLNQEPHDSEDPYDQLMERIYVFAFPTSSADIDCLYKGSTPPQKSFRNQLLTSETESDYEDIID